MRPRRAAMAASLVAAMVTFLPGVSSTRASAAAGPTITATPSTGLVDYQTIVVDGSGYEPNAILEIYECGKGAVDVTLCDGYNAYEFDSDSNGDVHFDFTVDARIYGHDGQEIDCRAEPDGCLIGVGYLVDNDQWPKVPLDFDPDASLRPPVTAGVTPDEQLVDGQEIVVRGANLSPLEPAWVLECVSGARPLVCDFRRGAQPVPEADGTLRLPYTVTEVLHATSGEVVDCRAAPGTCSIGVSWGYSSLPDRYAEAPLTFGVRDITDACSVDEVPEVAWADVAPSSVHRPAIDCLAWKGIVQGVADDSYAPAQTVTRGQVASLVARLVTATGNVLPAAPPDAFADDEGSVHEPAIDALVAIGIVDGRPDGTYGPNDPVGRGQIATILAGVAEYVTGNPLPGRDVDHFADDAGNVHEPAINQLAGAGVVGGITTTTYGPGNVLRRDQAASMIARLLDLAVQAG